ncbi:MAG: ATP-grasp domain-containing protein, partial [Holophagales bacterium]|nr:ATP-grasp domain-containing protein [Holophagales bacterium]
MSTFQRLAIVNRGEPAMRLIHAARELCHDGWDLTTIALYTDPERRAMFVREADEAFPLGSSTFTDPEDGNVKNRYLDYASLERTLREARADAVWVGWGFVAEHAAFADLCERMGIVFVGPSGDVMRRLGDKISSKLLAEAAEVPVAPWSGGAVDSLKQAREVAAELGYPLMIKATAGGGGRGIRKVEQASRLEGAFESARAEALKAFGDATVFFERLVQAARHIEVQVVADGKGGVWALGVRDCTLQRRHQKVLEETPSPALDAEQDAEVRAAAARLVLEAGYRNAGTVEFLYEPEDRTFAFMEVNARLQVEHPVTELVTGADLVKLQLHVAAGGRLEGEPPPSRGHAAEVRLNAEDPANDFAPAPGEVELLRLPTGPGLRIDTGIEEGDSIPADFDSMVAKIMAVGRDRTEALSRLRRALRDTAVVVRGGSTNKGFLLEMLARPEIESGEIDVAWLDRLTARGEHTSPAGAEVALLAAALEAYEAEIEAELGGFFASAVRGRPEVSAEVGRVVPLEVAGQRFRLHVYRLDPRRFRVEHGGRWIDLEVERLGAWERRLMIGEGEQRRRHRVLATAQGPAYLVEVDGAVHRVSRDDGGTVRAPAPAVVVSIHVEPGQQVE